MWDEDIAEQAALFAVYLPMSVDWRHQRGRWIQMSAPTAARAAELIVYGYSFIRGRRSAEDELVTRDQ